MSVGHAHALYLHGDSLLHRLPAQCKLAAMVLFVLAVVATPREAFWAFGVQAAIVAALVAVAGIPARFFATRLLIEVPFLLFAVFLPFLGGGRQVYGLSVEGLWGAWTIFAKGTLGVSASVLMAATTPVPEILSGMDRLRVPRVITAIAGFMVRYLEVIAGEIRRQRIAMLSRGYRPRWLWQARGLATAAGALFVRAYERGERVYFAMASRGYQGQMPVLDEARVGVAPWVGAIAVALAAWGVALAARVVS